MFKSMAVLLLLSTAMAGRAATLSQAREAYDRNQVAEAQKLYAAIAADRASGAKERAGAEVELARIAWLIDGDADIALHHLQAATAAGGAPCDAGIMTLRVLHESNRLKQAIGSELRLIGACSDAAKRDQMRIHAIASRLELAGKSLPERAGQLRAAKLEEAKLGPDAGGGGARVRLQSALMSNDARAGIAAWKDYFWLKDGDGPPALADLKPAETFKAGLAPGASAKHRVDLAHLLMRAGFADALRDYLATHPVAGEAANARWKLVQAYLVQRQQLTETVAQVNCSLAHGGPRDDKRLQQAGMKALGALMSAANAKGDPKRAMAEFYGIVASLGLTSGYPSLHMGHLVEDRSETVRQYGHQATIHFQVIDNLWANGFESWLWDGDAETGGWSGDDKIVQVRSAYTAAPAAAYALVGDTPSRRELLAKLPTLEAGDLAQVRSGTPGPLPGLAARLRLQLIDEIAAAARRSPGARDLRHAFLAEYWRANNQQSVFVHEGRHAIDKAMAADPSKLDDTTLEYQAKLSELALSDYPRMGLWNMDRGIGGSTAHEHANTRIFHDLGAWIETHPQSVAGHDPALPAVVQVDKLTDAQIREIAWSLDPLARAQPTTASSGSRSGTSRR